MLADSLSLSAGELADPISSAELSAGAPQIDVNQVPLTAPGELCDGSNAAAFMACLHAEDSSAPRLADQSLERRENVPPSAPKTLGKAAAQLVAGEGAFSDNVDAALRTVWEEGIGQGGFDSVFALARASDSVGDATIERVGRLAGIPVTWRDIAVEISDGEGWARYVVEGVLLGNAVIEREIESRSEVSARLEKDVAGNQAATVLLQVDQALAGLRDRAVSTYIEHGLGVALRGVGGEVLVSAATGDLPELERGPTWLEVMDAGSRDPALSALSGLAKVPMDLGEGLIATPLEVGVERGLQLLAVNTPLDMDTAADLTRLLYAQPKNAQFHAAREAITPENDFVVVNLAARFGTELLLPTLFKGAPKRVPSIAYELKPGEVPKGPRRPWPTTPRPTPKEPSKLYKPDRIPVLPNRPPRPTTPTEPARVPPKKTAAQVGPDTTLPTTSPLKFEPEVFPDELPYAIPEEVPYLSPLEVQPANNPAIFDSPGVTASPVAPVAPNPLATPWWAPPTPAEEEPDEGDNETDSELEPDAVPDEVTFGDLPREELPPIELPAVASADGAPTNSDGPLPPQPAGPDVPAGPAEEAERWADAQTEQVQDGSRPEHTAQELRSQPTAGLGALVGAAGNAGLYALGDRVQQELERRRAYEKEHETTYEPRDQIARAWDSDDDAEDPDITEDLPAELWDMAASERAADAELSRDALELGTTAESDAWAADEVREFWKLWSETESNVPNVVLENLPDEHLASLYVAMNSEVEGVRKTVSVDESGGIDEADRMGPGKLQELREAATNIEGLVKEYLAEFERRNAYELATGLEYDPGDVVAQQWLPGEAWAQRQIDEFNDSNYDALVFADVGRLPEEHLRSLVTAVERAESDARALAEVYEQQGSEPASAWERLKARELRGRHQELQTERDRRREYERENGRPYDPSDASAVGYLPVEPRWANSDITDPNLLQPPWPTGIPVAESTDRDPTNVPLGVWIEEGDLQAGAPGTGSVAEGVLVDPTANGDLPASSGATEVSVEEWNELGPTEQKTSVVIIEESELEMIDRWAREGTLLENVIDYGPARFSPEAVERVFHHDHDVGWAIQNDRRGVSATDGVGDEQADAAGPEAVTAAGNGRVGTSGARPRDAGIGRSNGRVTFGDTVKKIIGVFRARFNDTTVGLPSGHRRRSPAPMPETLPPEIVASADQDGSDDSAGAAPAGGEGSSGDDPTPAQTSTPATPAVWDAAAPLEHDALEPVSTPQSVAWAERQLAEFDSGKTAALPTNPGILPEAELASIASRVSEAARERGAAAEVMAEDSDPEAVEVGMRAAQLAGYGDLYQAELGRRDAYEVATGREYDPNDVVAQRWSPDELGDSTSDGSFEIQEISDFGVPPLAQAAADRSAEEWGTLPTQMAPPPTSDGVALVRDDSVTYDEVAAWNAQGTLFRDVMDSLAAGRVLSRQALDAIRELNPALHWVILTTPR